jgi:diguanylate cyclase (GGDEF)-like protein
MKTFEEKLNQMALYDELTALPNRRLFFKNSIIALADAKRNKRNLALLFVDLDGFKLVNDKLGHNAGDKVLKKVALRIQSRLRVSDTIARIGGDEFIILIAQHEGSNAAKRVSDAIIKEMQKPLQIEGSYIAVGASIGISYYPDDGTTINSLLRKADTAMYVAKGKGKNHWQEYKFVPTCGK